jgi:hypothetical protein
MICMQKQLSGKQQEAPDQEELLGNFL